MVVGIDLGTTFSVVAKINQDGKAEVITNQDGERTTPSVVMFDEGNIVVGEQAKENSISNPLNVVQFVKRQMGDAKYSFETEDNKKYTAEEISAMILKKLKIDAEKNAGEQIKDAVITVPAYFSDAQRKATQDAGRIAGLNVLGIINEPTAAAVAYCHNQVQKGGTFLVFDLGGGTFDITIMKISDDLKDVHILSTEGDRRLGGFDFDNLIINHVAEAFEDKYGIELIDDEIAYQDLRIKAENAKKALSTRQKASISISSIGNVLKVDITRDEFESMMTKYLKRIELSLDMALDAANLQAEDLDRLLLVGGSTRIPCVQKMLENKTKCVISMELNPDEAVAIGAAYYAQNLCRDGTTDSKINVVDVNSHALGVVTVDEYRHAVMSEIIPKNTSLPAYGEKTFYTVVDDQTSVKVEVVEGEDEELEYDTLIGSAVIRLDPKPQGAPIIVRMECDINGIIHVRLADEITGKDLGEFRIERQANLPDDQIDEMKNKMENVEME